MRTPSFLTRTALGSGDQFFGLRLLWRLLGHGRRSKVPPQRTHAVTVLPAIDFDGEDTSLTQAELEVLK